MAERKCVRCKHNKAEIDFLKGDRFLKCCINCRKYNVKNSLKHRCKHDKSKYDCRLCGTKKIPKKNKKKYKPHNCSHNIPKKTCKKCNLHNILKHIVSNHIRRSLGDEAILPPLVYLDCTIEELIIHIEEGWVEGMNWDNHGKWHIDHICPLKYRMNGKRPTIEQSIERCHYSNLQPLWAGINTVKGYSYIG